MNQDIMRRRVLVAAIVVAATALHAEPIAITNHSLEANQERLQLVDRPWTGNIEGWNSDSAATDSGVDVEGSALVTTVLDGRTYGFIRSTDPAVWQTAGHTIGYGEVLTLTFDAFNCWGGTAIIGSLYYVNDAGARVILASTTVDEMVGGIPYVGSLTYLAMGQQGELGHFVGVEFDNPSEARYSWSAFDNVRLDSLNGLSALYPSPTDGAKEIVCRSVPLSWTTGLGCIHHDVYLGLSYDEVAGATQTAAPTGVYMGRQDPNTLLVPALKPGRTYYWRVDEVAADDTITKGAVWQFDTELEGYPIPGTLITATASSSQAGSGPENTINGSGLDAQDGHSTLAADMWQSASGAAKPVWIQYAFDRAYKLDEMWVWNYNGDLEYAVGFGLKEVTVEYSLDGSAWTALGNVTFNQGASAPHYTHNTTVDFKGTVARYVRLTVNSSYGSGVRHGLSEVRFLYIPTYARQPHPEPAATEVDTDVVLTWRAGRDAASHSVYLSTDQQTVETGTALVGTVSENLYTPGTLDLDRTYYWKINEVNAAEPIPSWEGRVWDFTTQEYYLVDGFETYNDNKDAGLAIWQTWVDGYGTTDNGVQVGHNPPPYAERDTVHSGRQSMPFYYGNGGSATRSEAVRTFDPPQDWTRGGVRALVLYFQGGSENTGRLYVKINGTQVVYNGAATDLAKPFWIQWTVDLTQVSTDLKQVRTMAIGVDNGGSGMLFFDDIRLYREAPQQATEEVWIEAEAADSIEEPMQIYSDRADASGGRYIATFGDNSSGDPPDNGGVASYTVRLAGGTYRIIGRVIAPTGADDSFWVRFEGATTNTTNHVSGWIRWALDIGEAWHEVPVRSMDDADQTVLFTVGAGIYNLEIGYREDGALLDAWIITKQLE